MFVLGIILIVLSAGGLVAVLASGTDDRSALYGGDVTMPTLVVFLAGAAALLLFIMGLELVRSGLKRANQNRKNKRRLRKLEKQQGSTPQTVPASGPATSDRAPESATGHSSPGGPPAPPAGTSAPPSSAPPAAGGPYENPPPTR